MGCWIPLVVNNGQNCLFLPNGRFGQDALHLRVFWRIKISEKKNNFARTHTEEGRPALKMSVWWRVNSLMRVLSLFFLLLSRLVPLCTSRGRQHGSNKIWIQRWLWRSFHSCDSCSRSQKSSTPSLRAALETSADRARQLPIEQTWTEIRLFNLEALPDYQILLDQMARIAMMSHFTALCRLQKWIHSCLFPSISLWGKNPNTACLKCGMSGWRSSAAPERTTPP